MSKGQNLIQIGAIVGAIGTIVSAISSTPDLEISQSAREDLDYFGYYLENVGTAIAASDEEYAIETLGELLVAVGDFEVALTYLMTDDEAQEFYSRQGALIQILGVIIDLPFGQKLSMNETMEVMAEILGLTGVTIQLLADPESDEGAILSWIGGWIEAIGAVLAVITIENDT